MRGDWWRLVARRGALMAARGDGVSPMAITCRAIARGHDQGSRSHTSIRNKQGWNGACLANGSTTDLDYQSLHDIRLMTGEDQESAGCRVRQGTGAAFRNIVAFSIDQ